MKYVPLASVATRRFEDTAATKEVLAGLEAAVRLENGFRVSSEAQFAMGWWFFTIGASPAVARRMLDQGMIRGSGTSAADQIISMIQAGLDSAGCDARAKRASEPSIFARYWAWLLG